ncbi:hypothetical protein [Limnoraphis robusta]|uniref:hypothetical protein n=1 Tax=Limnoraphis robusta TaxID=1118279 RepID=UPI002B213B89|nr:hypothetical protein [Limnoraphis robusta]MEA5498024.1 hypothetical protein [Limnoraphis robusta BA-68 BA1]
MKKVGRIDDVNQFVLWCQKYESFLEKDKYYSGIKRRIYDFKNGIDERGLKLINRFCEPETILLLKYEINGGLKLHRDSGVGKTAYTLSSVDFEFSWDGKLYKCKAGDIYSFDGKKLHGLNKKLNSERWCLVWWEKENDYQLSLF